MALPFMTYEQLLDKLEYEKHLTIPDRACALALLEEKGYNTRSSYYETIH